MSGECTKQDNENNLGCLLGREEVGEACLKAKGRKVTTRKISHGAFYVLKAI
jgi:hypothetical protein